MTKYYKGKLFYKKDLINEKNVIIMANDLVVDLSNKEFYEKFKLLNDEEKDRLDKFFATRLKKEIEIPDGIQSLLRRIYNNYIYEYINLDKDIIYEIIIDENNNMYGKELLTGNIFPIASDKELDFKITDVNEIKRLFVNCSNKRNTIMHYKDENEIHTDLFYDEKGIEYSVISGYYSENVSLYTIKPVEYIGDFYERCGYKIDLLAIPKIIFSNLERGEVFIDNHGIANIEEINAYKLKYQDKIFNKSRRRKFFNDLKNYAEKNVYKGEIIPKKEEVNTHLQVDELAKIMERVEFLLIKLKSYNEREYNKCKSEYDALINPYGNELHLTINKAVLESLEARITLSFKFDKASGDNILDYLESKKNEYLDNLLNNNIVTSLTIKDIDKIMELYLKMQNDFDILDKRKIIRNISLLYLLELIENKDNYNEIDLQSSYLNDNLLTIIIWINTLKELDIIEINSLFDISINYTTSDILEIIKSVVIKEIENEKIKKLV